MQTRGNVRQGFGGNYRRNGSASSESPSKTPSPPAHQPSPRSPPGSLATNPPPVETVVKVATVMTVTKQLPPAEQKVQIEQGPRVTSPTAELSHASRVHSNDMAHSNHALSGQSEEQPQTQSPSVRAMLSNFQNAGGGSPQAWNQARRPLTSTRDYVPMPMPRAKVKELKETLILRASNESLNEDTEDRVSPSHSAESSNVSQPPVLPSSVLSERRIGGNISDVRDQMKKNGSRSQERNGDTHSSSQPNRKQDTAGSQFSHQQPINSDMTNGGGASPEIRVEMGDLDVRGQGQSASTALDVRGQGQSASTAPPHLHQRQKSQEEIDYEKQAAVVAQRLRDEDKRLSEVRQLKVVVVTVCRKESCWFRQRRNMTPETSR